MYIKLTNGVPENYSVSQLRRDNPQVSFPETPSEECLAEWGIFPLEDAPAPVVDHTKIVSTALPVQINGKWVQTWDICDATEVELAARTTEQAAAVRQERSVLLAASDWTQVSDAPVDKAAWSVYRQALRDITTQQGFPWVIIWPTVLT